MAPNCSQPVPACHRGYVPQTTAWRRKRHTQSLKLNQNGLGLALRPAPTGDENPGPPGRTRARAQGDQTAIPRCGPPEKSSPHAVKKMIRCYAAESRHKRPSESRRVVLRPPAGHHSHTRPSQPAGRCLNPPPATAGTRGQASAAGQGLNPRPATAGPRGNPLGPMGIAPRAHADATTCATTLAGGEIKVKVKPIAFTMQHGANARPWPHTPEHTIRMARSRLHRLPHA